MKDKIFEKNSDFLTKESCAAKLVQNTFPACLIVIHGTIDKDRYCVTCCDRYVRECYLNDAGQYKVEIFANHTHVSDAKDIIAFFKHAFPFCNRCGYHFVHAFFELKVKGKCFTSENRLGIISDWTEELANHLNNFDPNRKRPRIDFVNLFEIKYGWT